MARTFSKLAALSLLVLVTTFMLGGCAGTTKNATSVVDYLFPDTKDPVVAPSTPVLTLPLRVGIAFVPGTANNRWQSSGALTEQKKNALMQQVADHFKKYPYVKDIEIIPTSYLRPAGSFANLEQIRTMYGVDVIALLSYDQVQFTDEGSLSLTYWTIVGAYIIPGEKNDTQTMLDAVVYDIPSRKMLFRAPGMSRVKGSSTPVNQSEELRADSSAGFDAAAKEMIVNLDQQLAVFKDKVKERPQEYKVVRSAGYSGGSGGGSLDVYALVAILGLGGVFLWRQRRN